MARYGARRWLAAVGLVTAATAYFGAPAGALQAEQLEQPLPLPVELSAVPRTVPLTLPPLPVPLPELPPLLGDKPAPRPGTSTTPQPRSVPPESRPAAPAPAPAPAPTAASARPASAPSPNGPSGAAVDTAQVDLDREAVRTARRFALPLGLSASLIAFLAVQARVDRRDPKLAMAPVEDEVFGFQ